MAHQPPHQGNAFLSQLTLSSLSRTLLSLCLAEKPLSLLMPMVRQIPLLPAPPGAAEGPEPLVLKHRMSPLSLKHWQQTKLNELVLSRLLVQALELVP